MTSTDEKILYTSTQKLEIAFNNTLEKLDEDVFCATVPSRYWAIYALRLSFNWQSTGRSFSCAVFFVTFFCAFFVSCLRPLSFPYEGWLWKENLMRRIKEACSCSAVRVTGRDIGEEGNLSCMWVSMAGHSLFLVEIGYKRRGICCKSSVYQWTWKRYSLQFKCSDSIPHRIGRATPFRLLWAPRTSYSCPRLCS